MPSRIKLMIPGPVDIFDETLEALGQKVYAHYGAEWQPIYGETMGVELVSYIRPERKFASQEQLKGQIYADIEKSKTVLM